MPHDHKTPFNTAPDTTPAGSWPEGFLAHITGDGCPMRHNDYTSDDIGWGILLRRGEAAGRHAEFEAEARQLLEQRAAGAGLVENAVFTVLLARRPGGNR